MAGKRKEVKGSQERANLEFIASLGAISYLAEVAKLQRLRTGKHLHVYTNEFSLRCSDACCLVATYSVTAYNPIDLVLNRGRYVPMKTRS